MADEGFFKNLAQGDLAGLGQNIYEGARDEWLGIDDFRRALKYGSSGDFRKALKSLGAGTLELGGTALMVLPGGQLAALGAKGGKLGKAVQLLKPLTLEQQAAARLAKAGGAKRSLFSSPALTSLDDIIGKEIVIKPTKEAAKSKVGKTLSGLKPDMIVGYGPGGIGGSLLRGLGQFTGALPAEQGLLARRAFAARNAGLTPSASARVGAALSGKLGSAATRTGVDSAILGAAMGGEMAASRTAGQPSIIDLYLQDLTTGSQNVPQIRSMADAILMELLGGISPQAAM